MLNFYSEESEILLNPRMPQEEQNKLNIALQKIRLSNHIFLATSGSTATNSQQIKWVALKKSAFLLSAHQVNSHLNCDSSDVFLNTLPHFHVGGLALFARAQLCKGKIIDDYALSKKWSAAEFLQKIIENKVTVSSLVPTQLFDIVSANFKAPSSLKAIVIGGGGLPKRLYEKAQILGWPLLPSYGMTECCSQVATASYGFSWERELPQLTILPHVKLSLNSEDRIEIESDCLLSGYLIPNNINNYEWLDPKVNSKILTSDIGKIKENTIVILGRCDDNIKINGENVSLLRLQNLWDEEKEHNKFHYDGAIFAKPHSRNGMQIALALEKSSEGQSKLIESMLNNFHNHVFSFEQIRSLHFCNQIHRTELGKIQRNKLTEMISKLD